MNKVKVSTGLASLALVAGLLFGEGTLLTVIALLLIFCDVENIKGVIVRVLSFAVGIVLFTTLWNLIVRGYGLIQPTLNSILGPTGIIGSYLDKPIDLTKLNKYLFNPIGSIISICDSFVSYFILIVKFGFVVSFLEGKVAKENFISKFVNKFVDKAIAFVNGFEN